MRENPLPLGLKLDVEESLTGLPALRSPGLPLTDNPFQPDGQLTVHHTAVVGLGGPQVCQTQYPTQERSLCCGLAGPYPWKCAPIPH